MTIWAVTGHAGARDWLARQGVVVDVWVESLDVEKVHAGDTVVGTLPIPLAGNVCARGARYRHLTVPLPVGLAPADRRRELSADDLDRLGAALQYFEVRSEAD